jgi:hypothetical protein
MDGPTKKAEGENNKTVNKFEMEELKILVVV